MAWIRYWNDKRGTKQWLEQRLEQHSRERLDDTNHLCRDAKHVLVQYMLELGLLGGSRQTAPYEKMDQVFIFAVFEALDWLSSVLDYTSYAISAMKSVGWTQNSLHPHTRSIS